MNERQNRIVEILNEKDGWQTGKQLAMMLNVSDRTIRSDIESINKEHIGLITANFRHGYMLNKDVLGNNKAVDNHIPQNAKERCKYIIFQLLFNVRRINLFDFEQEIFVSEFTLRNDLKTINRMVEELDSNLKLVKDGNYISLEGSEVDKRLLYRKMLTQETHGDFVNIDKINDLFPDLDLIRIKNLLEKVFDEYGYKIRKETFPMLIIHVGVAIERMMGENYVDVSRKQEIVETQEYKISKTFFKDIQSFTNLELNENEIQLFASLLLGKRNRQYLSSEIYSTKAEILSKKIVEGIQSQYDIDFSTDAFFSNGLIVHLQNLLERLDRGLNVSNVYLGEIKKNYPLVFEMSVFVGRIIENEIQKVIKEDELGYLTIHIGAAYDRLNTKRYYHAILIHPNGNMLSSICYRKIMDKFDERLVIDAVMDYYEESVVDNLHPDFILSTVHLVNKKDVPIVYISMFVNTNDEFKLAKLINEMDSQQNRKAFAKWVDNLVIDDCYFYNLEANDYLEVIQIMGSKMQQLGLVNDNFIESTIEREKKAFTSFSYGFAIPHPLDYVARKSTIAIAILKKPIMWGGYSVKFVLLLAIRSDEKDLLRVFFDWFSDISDNDKLISDIISTNSAKGFIELIKGNGLR